MMFTSIISAEELKQVLADEQLVIIDCRFDLMNPEAGRQQYQQSHIPGALFADINTDLSGPPLTDHGRHPLPSVAALTDLFSSLGIHSTTQVIAYDDAKGAFAARLWWLLRYLGHESVAVLEGGWSAWQAAGYAESSASNPPVAGVFQAHVQAEWLVLLDEVSQQPLLIDSREPARYRGEQEPIDPIAGHIPGAINRCWKENLDTDGCFKPAATLREEFAALQNAVPDQSPVFYCGSGVTACHNLLAYHHAGLAPARLYAGSWSEWCADASRPVATGT